jgi:hypothetical protein
MKSRQDSKQRPASGIKVRAAIKGGKISANRAARALSVRSDVKAGKIGANHNRRLLPASARLTLPFAACRPRV